MFSKTLILVLLGVSLTLASPAITDEVDAILSRASWTDKISETWKSIETAANGILDKLKQNFDQALEQAKKDYGHAQEISQEKLSQLKKDYEELQKNTKAAIEEQQKIWGDRLKEAMDLGHSSLKEALEKLKKLKNDAEKAINDQVHRSQEAYQKWRDSVKDALNKKGNTVQ